MKMSKISKNLLEKPHITGRKLNLVLESCYKSLEGQVLDILSCMLCWPILSTECPEHVILLWPFAASAMFHLVCNLQVIHFEDYAKLLDGESEISLFIYEHIRLRYYLSKISHRFRILLLLQFPVVTVSQFTTLFQTTAYSGRITYINGGDFAATLQGYPVEDDHAIAQAALMYLSMGNMKDASL
ncbi:unnamed protein product [Thlaspi arvense]|uniref:Uncharacterized protein n=1 Tax=Thlaspi arvense TaxID=13288 RepID=A0AAU9SYE4_THLAR|nr:unnamed protein product [Thlaspi arvense]